jgi:hypothetical protein
MRMHVNHNDEILLEVLPPLSAFRKVRLVIVDTLASCSTIEGEGFVSR